MSDRFPLFWSRNERYSTDDTTSFLRVNWTFFKNGDDLLLMSSVCIKFGTEVDSENFKTK